MKLKIERGKWKVATRKSLRVFFVVFSLSTFNFQLSTAQQGEIEQQNAVVRRSQERLAEIEKESKALSGEIVNSERDLRVARSTIAAKRKVAADLDRETRRITAEINANTRATRRLDSTLTDLKRDYGRMVYTAWKNHKTTGTTLFLLSAKDFNDASRRISFIRRYNRAREKRGAEIDSLNRSLTVEMERLAVQKGEISGLKRESDRLLADLAGEQSRYESALKSLGKEQKEIEAEAKRERAKIAAAQREIERIMARQARGIVLSEADMALSGQFGENKGRLPWPTGDAGLILHHFGKERKGDGIERDFSGLIIAARPGSEVTAVFEGKVTWITDLAQYNKCVIVSSGEYFVGYGNIASPTVKNGEKVSLGQSLGRVTASDNSGLHQVLIWMQHGEEILDPEEWLRQ
jgi:septal ring factor EnvC (AmiA/AmiB activator)